MLAASHAIAGAIIASQTNDPTIAYSASIISHPLLDLMPHWDLSTRTDKNKTNWKIIWTSLLDAAIGFTIGYLLFHNSVDTKILFFSMFLAQLPDWLEAPLHVFNWKFPPFTTIKKAQHLWHTKLDWPWGFIPQVLMVLIAIIIAF